MGTDIHLDSLCQGNGFVVKKWRPKVDGFVFNVNGADKPVRLKINDSDLDRPRSYAVFAEMAGVRGQSTGLLEYVESNEDFGGHNGTKIRVSSFKTSDPKWDKVHDNPYGWTYKQVFGWYYDLFKQLEEYCKKNRLDPEITYLQVWFDS